MLKWQHKTEETKEIRNISYRRLYLYALAALFRRLDSLHGDYEETRLMLRGKWQPPTNATEVGEVLHT